MCTEQKCFQQLLDVLSGEDKTYNLEKITAAYEFARIHHEGQLRKSGEPFVCHPIEVAKIATEFGLDSDSIVAALLHDTVEDTSATQEELKEKFGNDVAELVNGVTKLGQIPYSSKEEAQIEYLRKMFFAMAKDLRVILIKLADRLHNMRTLSSVPKEKQLQKALETMEIYAPLSHRLGMQKVKLELEDTSLSYLDPVGYKMIEGRLSESVSGAGGFFEQTQQIIREKIGEHNINFDMEYRIKHIFSIYRKLFTQNKNFEEIYDIYAFRIIVSSANDCYFVLGLIHDLFNPIPGRFKDYISTPKPNMYQSLHTTVIGKDGIPFEVQIRTWDMHNTAEYGIAAHWKYKQGATSNETVDTKLKWIRNLLETQEDVGDTEDFITGLKVDLFADEVFVFTPRGDVIDLPLGANLIDFAYSIHSAVGNKMVGAKVNGKIVPLDYNLQTGEIVEILTTSSASHGPSRDWMKIAKTSEAKNKIRQWFKKECREENIKTGQEELDKEIKKLEIFLEKEDKQRIAQTVSERMHFQQLDDMYGSIGYGGTSAQKVANKIKDEALKLQKSKLITVVPITKPKASAGGVVVEGIDNCLIKFARCCNPLPGDYIAGFITKGFGVSIHKVDCQNAAKSMENEPERWLKAHWEDNTSKSAFVATISIVCRNDIGMMAKITATIADLKVSIHGLHTKEDAKNNDTSTVILSLEVKDLDHLNFIMKRIARIKGVIETKRS